MQRFFFIMHPSKKRESGRNRKYERSKKELLVYLLPIGFASTTTRQASALERLTVRHMFGGAV